MGRTTGTDHFATPDFVARIRGGDRDALGEVVHAYLPHILRAARGCGLDPDRAADVTQETFKTFIETAARFEGRSQVRTWLFGILYRKVSETRRAVRKDERHEDIEAVYEGRFRPDGMWGSPPREADRDLFAAQIRRHIEDCLEPLAERQRLAFVLREVEGLASQEICNVLDLTRTNLGVLLFRARNALRECLEDRLE